MKDESIFSGIGKMQMAKVIPVESHMTEPGLGLSKRHRDELVNCANIVINIAGYSRSSQPLRTAIGVNVLPLREIIQLCREIQSLEGLCHISTAYSQTQFDEETVIEEKIYEPTVDYIQLLEDVKLKRLPRDGPEIKRILGTHLNTYPFSKGIGEYVLAKEASDLPLIIHRPSMVTPTHSDPIEGWTTGLMYVDQIGAFVALGILRTMRFDANIQDFVPVDMVVNNIISTIYHCVSRRSKYPFVTNCVNGDSNPSGYLDLMEQVSKITAEYPLPNMYRKPYCRRAESSLEYNVRKIKDHLLPAMFTDVQGFLTGCNTGMLEKYNLIHKGENAIRNVISRNWMWETSSQSSVKSSLDCLDQKEFTFDWKSINWDDYYRSMTFGMKKYNLRFAALK